MPSGTAMVALVTRSEGCAEALDADLRDEIEERGVCAIRIMPTMPDDRKPQRGHLERCSHGLDRREVLEHSGKGAGHGQDEIALREDSGGERKVGDADCYASLFRLRPEST